MRARWACGASARVSTRERRDATRAACSRIRAATAPPKASVERGLRRRFSRRDRGTHAAMNRSPEAASSTPRDPLDWLRASHAAAGRCAAGRSCAVRSIQAIRTSASRASAVARAIRRSRRRSLSRTARPRTSLQARRVERSRRTDTRKSWRASSSPGSPIRPARSQASVRSASATMRAPSAEGRSRISGSRAMGRSPDPSRYSATRRWRPASAVPGPRPSGASRRWPGPSRRGGGPRRRAASSTRRRYSRSARSRSARRSGSGREPDFSWSAARARFQASRATSAPRRGVSSASSIDRSQRSRASSRADEARDSTSAWASAARRAIASSGREPRGAAPPVAPEPGRAGRAANAAASAGSSTLQPDSVLPEDEVDHPLLGHEAFESEAPGEPPSLATRQVAQPRRERSGIHLDPVDRLGGTGLHGLRGRPGQPPPAGRGGEVGSHVGRDGVRSVLEHGSHQCVLVGRPPAHRVPGLALGEAHPRPHVAVEVLEEERAGLREAGSDARRRGRAGARRRPGRSPRRSGRTGRCRGPAARSRRRSPARRGSRRRRRRRRRRGSASLPSSS